MGSSVASTVEDEPQSLDLDDLSKVTDIVLRRRIQNRLAQRLRRQKLRDEKASQAALLEPSKEGQSTPSPAPSKSHNNLANVSDGLSKLSDISMSEGEIAAILSRLDQTLAQLKERVATKPSESQLSTSKLSLDSTYPSQAYWDPYMKPGFDSNHSGTWSNSFELLTSVLGNGINDTAERRKSFAPNDGDNAVSTDLQVTTASPWLATPKPHGILSALERVVLESLPRSPNPHPFCLKHSLTSDSISEALSKSPVCNKPAYARSTSNNSNSQTNAISCARGSTALHLAAQQGHFETVSLLLQNGGVDINACNSDGLSALHIAVTNNHTNLAHLLLTHGANSALRTNAGLSILHLAVLHGTLPLVLLVLRYVTVPGDLDLRDQDGRSAFHLAVARGDQEIVSSLLEKGANSMAKVGEQTSVEQVAMSF